MINYFGKFAYDMSTTTKKLRIMLNKSVECNGDRSKSEQDLKTLLSTRLLLKLYDPQKTENTFRCVSV